MHVPKWAIALNFVFVALITGWAVALTLDRNPFPWPDPGSRIFAASSPEAKAAVVELLAQHGVKERFKVNTSGILRSIMWDGTIVNHSPPAFTQKVGNASSAIGLVSGDPNMLAYFVTTDAMLGTAINFRPPVSQMPSPN